MANPVVERRKFVRVDVNLESWINTEVRSVMKNLSLGGCSVETETPLHIKDLVCIKIFLEGKRFVVWGNVLYSQKEKNYGIRFNHLTKEQNLRLIKVIENTHKTSTLLRPIRVSVQEKAVLDREAALITNISEGGCCLQTSESFNSHDLIEIKFRINSEEMRLVGQVRWVGQRGIGIQFLSPDPAQICTISKYVSLKLSSSPQAFS